MKNRNRIIVLLIMILGVFIMPKEVDAVPLCLKTTKTKYETLARKAKIKYTIKNDGYGEPYYKLTVENLDSNLLIRIGNNDYSNPSGNDIIQLPDYYKPNSEYTFYVYTIKDLYECGDAFILKKTVQLPFYNIYSERSECIEYEEFPLCGIHYTGTILDDEDFDNQLEEWLKQNVNEVEEYKDDRNLIQRFTDFYKDNIQISVAVTIVLALLFIALVIRAIVRKIKRSKINI